jgi:hypothetical protein
MGVAKQRRREMGVDPCGEVGDDQKERNLEREVTESRKFSRRGSRGELVETTNFMAEKDAKYFDKKDKVKQPDPKQQAMHEALLKKFKQVKVNARSASSSSSSSED